MRATNAGSAWLMMAMLALACGSLGSCTGDLDDGPDLERRDAGPPPSSDAGASPCGDVGRIIVFFETQCAGCHQGSRFPELGRAGLSRLSSLDSQIAPGTRLLVPGDPEGSFLYRKMAHTQGAAGGANMPLGHAEPVAELAMIAQWIRDGASTACDELDPPDVAYDPNTLDPEELFSCVDPTASRSSPSRLRRVSDEELTQATMNAPGLGQNPLAPPEGLPYTTYAEGVGMDSATLRLLMMQLPVAAAVWTAGDPIRSGGAGRQRGISSCCTDRSSVVSCMEAATPTEACIDGYVETLLRRGALFRAPSDDERARLRAYLVSRLASETTDGITRAGTLSEIAQAALLMTGSLFRSDVGDPETMVETRRRLSNTELAFVLGATLSHAPVGVPISGGYDLSDDPDFPDFVSGRMGRIALAAEDGTIQDAATRVALFRHYATGTSQQRPDLYSGYRDTRGEFWIAPRLASFFREWLGYGTARTVFKDNPASTSAFPSTGLQYDGAVLGYNSLRSPSVNSATHEANLLQQMDDLVARVVVESDASGQDVFESLLTTRLAFLPRAEARTVWAYGWTEDDARDPETRWVTHPEHNPRMGVLMHPAWLSAHGGNFEDDASLVLRGYWLRTQIFCQAFGDLGDVAGLQAMLGPSDPMHSARMRVRRATEPGVDPEADEATVRSCWGCHQYMNTLGNAFERFNHAGFERAMDHGGPVDDSTVVDNLPDPALNRSYTNVGELVEAIARSRYARRGLIRHAFRYFMGRDETLADGCTLTEMEGALDRTGSFLSMLEALIASDTFVWRDLATEEEMP